MPSTQQKLSEAFARHQSGAIDEAVALYRAVLSEEPHNADALHMLGVIAQQKGNAPLALNLIEAALGKRSDLPFGWHNRSLVLHKLGRTAEALQSSEQAVALAPAHAEAWKMLGILAREMKDYKHACACHKLALELQPDDASLAAEYALSLYTTGDLATAHRVMQDALRRDAKLSPLTLANILKRAGYPNKALPYLRRAGALMPDNAEIAAAEALALLQTGDFAQGWARWEARPDHGQCYQAMPLWQGQKVDHLLLHEDQGLGDTLHFARYVPFARNFAQRVTLQVAPTLQRVLAENFPDVTVISADEPVPSADARARLASLPFWHKTAFENVPLASYLHAHLSWRLPWRQWLQLLPQPQVGFIWAGNPANRNDHNRSLPRAAINPILQAGGKNVISLQKNTAAPEGIFDAAPMLDDFATTAGLLAEIDLLITVDTAAAHLAGATGKPVWLLLAFDADWRWLLGREDSIWYPHMRLFRQTMPGDWAPVIAAVAGELGKFIGGDKSVLQPKPWQGAPLAQNPHALELGFGVQGSGFGV